MARKSKSSASTSSAAPMQDDILRQLKKITGSPEFLVTKRQLDFLNFVVSETLHGRSADLKGYLVATKVFGRTAEFDASTDPIVSIQANKLRRALERYYLVEGQRDPIRIDIPKGAYVPSFGWMKPVKADHTQSDSELEPLPEDSWPTILVKPFKDNRGRTCFIALETFLWTITFCLEHCPVSCLELDVPAEDVPLDGRPDSLKMTQCQEICRHPLPPYRTNEQLYNRTRLLLQKQPLF